MASLLKTKRFVWSVIFFVVTAMALVSYLSGKRYLAAVRAVEHTLAVESAINGTLSLLKDAETGQRGYILTGDRGFLEPYEAARREIPGHVLRLLAVAHDDDIQLERLRATRVLIDQKLAFIEDTVGFRGNGAEDEALVLVRSGRGKQLMDQIRAQCRAMLDHEERLLAVRKAEASTAERTAILGVGVGSVLTALLALVSLLTVHRDVELMKRTTENLAESEEYYRLLAEHGSDLVRLLSLNGVATYVSPSVERLLGYTVEEYMKLAPRSLMHPDELGIGAEILERIKAGRQKDGVSTYRLRHASGEYRWFEVRWEVRVDDAGNLLDLHTAGRDVTARLEAERQLGAYAAELRSLSLRDELTSLYNRRGFMEIGGQAHSQARRDGRAAALIFVDLNGMKRINDEQGHDIGDQALIDAAYSLKSALDEADVLGRLGGDEFVAFVLDFKPSDLSTLHEQLRELTQRCTEERQRTFRLSMSVGAAYMEAGSDVSLDELLDQADAAMYEQKNARRAAGGVSLPPAPPSAGR
ncbi:MAG: CHASE3 domain-containing protein [Polyangiaceae bacterium]